MRALSRCLGNNGLHAHFCPTHKAKLSSHTTVTPNHLCYFNSNHLTRRKQHPGSTGDELSASWLTVRSPRSAPSRRGLAATNLPYRLRDSTIGFMAMANLLASPAFPSSVQSVRMLQVNSPRIYIDLALTPHSYDHAPSRCQRSAVFASSNYTSRRVCQTYSQAAPRRQREEANPEGRPGR